MGEEIPVSEILKLSKKIFCEYLGLYPYLRVIWTKHRGTSKEYEGKCIEEYWKDLLGPYYAFEGAKKGLHRQDMAIFRDVILTDWVPMAPGLFYTKDMWRSSPQDMRVLFRDVRFDMHYGKKVLSIHYPKEFIAHTDISKGIPLVVNEHAYNRVKDVIDNYGAVHVEELRTTLSSIPEDFLKGLHLAEGIPRVVPIAEGKLSVKKTGTPDPLLGTAWTIYKSEQKREYLWYRFWIGVDYFENSLQDATQELNKIIQNEEGEPVFDFDEEVVRFPQAHIGPKDIIKLAESKKVKQFDAILSQLL